MTHDTQKANSKTEDLNQNISEIVLNIDIVNSLGASLVAQTVKNLPSMRETQARSPDWADTLEKGMAIHSCILAGRIHGQRTLVGYSLWGHKQLDMTKWLTHTHSHFSRYNAKTIRLGRKQYIYSLKHKDIKMLKCNDGKR